MVNQFYFGTFDYKNKAISARPNTLCVRNIVLPRCKRSEASPYLSYRLAERSISAQFMYSCGRHDCFLTADYYSCIIVTI